MSFGIVEIISLLLGLSGFGLQTNPRPPTVDQSLEYGMPDPDVVVQFDAASVIPGNYKVLSHLGDQPQIKASPELTKLVRQAVTEVESTRGLVKTTTGIDLTTDVADATAFVQIVAGHDPSFVVAVHGKFSTALVDKIAKLGGKAVVRAGASAWTEAGNNTVVAVTKTGVLLGGTTALVKARLDDAWKPPAHGVGTSLGPVADVLAGRPVFALVATLSQTARTEAITNLAGVNLATDLVKRNKLAAFAIYHDGLGWSWIDSSAAGLDTIAEMSDGLVDLMRAAQIAPRGIAKIVLGALDSYRGDKRIDDLLRHKADVMKVVDAYSGDGKFKVQVDKDAKALRLTVRLTARSLSEVMPGMLVPLGVIGALVMFRGTASSPPAQIAVPPMMHP